MNKSDIINKIESCEDLQERFFLSYEGESDSEYNAECVSSTGGESEGYHCSCVWSFNEGQFFLEFYGHHLSYDGSYYQGYREVEAKQKTITIWE